MPDGERGARRAVTRGGLIALVALTLVSAALVYFELAPSRPDFAPPAPDQTAEAGFRPGGADCRGEPEVQPASLVERQALHDRCAAAREAYRQQETQIAQARRNALASETVAVLTYHQAEAAAITTAVLILAISASLWAAIQARNAARAADKTLEHQQWAGERELRAYLFVTRARIDRIGTTDRYLVRFKVTNAGRTPAYRVEMRWRITVRAFPKSRRPWPVQDFSDAKCLEPLGPDDRTRGERVRLIPEAQMAAMREGKLALYLIGEIRFRDSFGRARWTRFRYMKGGDVGTRGSNLHTAEEGNETSEDNEPPFSM